jgi:hypothetical protein
VGLLPAASQPSPPKGGSRRRALLHRSITSPSRWVNGVQHPVTQICVFACEPFQRKHLSALGEDMFLSDERGVLPSCEERKQFQRLTDSTPGQEAARVLHTAESGFCLGRGELRWAYVLPGRIQPDSGRIPMRPITVIAAFAVMLGAGTATAFPLTLTCVDASTSQLRRSRRIRAAIRAGLLGKGTRP